MRLQRALDRADLLDSRVAGSDADRHPLIDLLLTRVADNSRRGARTDEAIVALAIEGGGLAGVVSAGMCVLLERAGVIDAIDVIYGTSSGALNGSFTASGQAALGSTNYQDTANRQFANPLRMLRGRAAINFDLLFDDLIRNRKPYSVEGLAAGPPFRALGIDLTVPELCVLKDFVDVEELMAAVRVSCSLPLLSGPSPTFRGRPMADGGLIESMPYATAIQEGATHVLVLRSRPAAYRKDPYPRAMIELVRMTGHPALAPLMRERPGRYNAEAEYLEMIAGSEPTLLQITPALGTPKVGQLERSEEIIKDGLITGANAAARAFGLAPVDLFWQPEVYAAS